MSVVGGKADEIGTITDIGQRMSAVGGRADVACQGLSGPFIAEAVEEVLGSARVAVIPWL